MRYLSYMKGCINTKMEVEYEPCKKGKCVLYPVCLQKETIKCYKLNHYIITLKISVGFDQTKFDIVWNDIDKILPRLKNALSIHDKFNAAVIRRDCNGY